VAAVDIRTLREHARAGDVAALTALGKRLLIGDGVPAAPSEAIACLGKASACGGGEATAQLALFAGWGVLRPRNLDEALDLLQRAAELGWAQSQHELRFLAHGTGTGWQDMRMRIDLAAWTAAPPVRVVTTSPRICAIDGFVSAAECDWLIERGRRNLRRAKVYRRDVSGHSAVDNRTNTESAFTVVNADLVLCLVRDRIAGAIGMPTQFFEMTKLLNYEPGQKFGLHADFLEPGTPALDREIREHGQRVLTFLAWLNDDYEGGETEFPEIGQRFKGRRGDALFFVNADASGAPDYRTIHAGLPPTSGVKWLLSQWVRNRASG
jgi:prolyl 4-hydroxylase